MNMSESRNAGVTPHGLSRTLVHTLTAVAALLVLVPLAFPAQDVPTDIELPGTQPLEAANFSTNCSCHYDTDNPQWEPGRGWEGNMMGNASRDPLFWATLAIAEQDFLPNADPDLRGGVGDLCIRCHSVGGWLAGRSTPTDGSGLDAADDRGVECEFCHLLVDPDQPVNVPGTVEEQNPPFEAFDPDTGEAYHGSGMWVLNSEGTRLGPYAEGDHVAKHAAFGSAFQRDADLCGTCHTVSNSAVGDLAYNHGAQEVMLESGTFSGVPGSPIEGKAAFNNPPYAYGMVERTSAEWNSSNWNTTLVNDFTSLPAELQHVGGAPDIAYHRAWDARQDADFEDGTLRYFTCQTCHMYARTGVGSDKQGTPIRTDLAQHDQTGAGHWVADAIIYQNNRGTLVFGGGFDQNKADAMIEAKQRAVDQLTRASSLSATQVGNDLRVTVTNLTGHKLCTGYPEGRRLWLNIVWKDGGGTVIHEDGAYGPLPRAAVLDLDGVPHQVESILDLEETVILEAEPGMDQQWAVQLSSLGYPDGMVLGYDRLTDAPYHTLGELKNEEPGEAYHTFHFALNNVMVHDSRIPPYGMRYDEARLSNALPIPYDQFGNPGPGGVYNHWADYDFDIPVGAETAEVRLFYQQTTWEYIQFLWLANDQQGPFLGQEGVNILDAWLNTSMAPPVEMAFASATVTGVVTGTPGEASHQEITAEQMRAEYNSVSGTVDITYTPACDAADHTVYYGPLSSVASYGYTDAACFLGTSGAASFDPGTDSYFFLVVANDGISEGSYGSYRFLAASAERNEASGLPACDYPQDLGGVICE
jgi:hypothetical protein